MPQIYVWLHRFKSHETLSYLFTSAESVGEAREKIRAKAMRIKETTTDCVYKNEGTEYYYKSSPLGSQDGVLHLGAPDSMTTEEICYLTLEITAALEKDPLFIGPIDSVGFVTAKD
jgi:hypothetical protein